MQFDQEAVLKKFSRNSSDRWKLSGASFVKLPDKIILDPMITPASLAAYAALRLHCRRKSGLMTCWPALESIKRVMHVRSLKTVVRAVRKLEELGYVTVERTKDGKTNNRYTLST